MVWGKASAIRRMGPNTRSVSARAEAGSSPLPAVGNGRESGSGLVYTTDDVAHALRRLALRTTVTRASFAASWRNFVGLPVTPPISVRLLERSGEQTRCFESEFVDPSVNADGEFRAME